MDVMDRAVGIGLQRYRELYPEGTIAPEVEARATLSVDPEREQFVVNLVYWLRNREDPFYFFKVAVDKRTDEVKVIVAAEPSEVSLAKLAEVSGEAAYLS